MDGCCGVDDGLLADSVEELRLQLPDGVGSGLIKSQLKKALSRFCTDSEVWRYAFELLPVVAGERIYSIADSDESAVIRVVELFEVDRYGKERLVSERKNIKPGVGQCWYSPEPDKVLLNELPRQSMVLRANVALKPVRGSERFPVSLYERWHEAIEAGALSKIYLMPDKDWTDYKQAQYRAGEYSDFVKQAKQVHLHNMKVGRPAYRSDVQNIWG